MYDETLLAIVYRGRPGTTQELATLAHLSPEEAEAAVTGLRAQGLIDGSGDELRYLDPAAWAAATVAARSAELRTTSQEALGALEQVMSDLPTLLQHWSVGEASENPVPVVTRHGKHASEDLWYETARHDGGTLCAVLPQLDRFLDPSLEWTTRFNRALARKDAVRVIVPTAMVDTETAILRLMQYRAAGVWFRLLDAPPSWFWVDGDQLALPFEWGEHRPTSALGMRNPALAGMAQAYFDQLWQRTEPLTQACEPWTPLLKLMRRGITLETASRRLGINPRTGRRRVAKAMEHYGVATLFALGVAWAASDSGRPQFTQGMPPDWSGVLESV